MTPVEIHKLAYGPEPIKLYNIETFGLCTVTICVQEVVHNAKVHIVQEVVHNTKVHIEDTY